MNLTQAQNFESFIAEKSAVRNGGLFMSVVLETEPKMNKTGNPFFGHVLKIQKLTGAAGFEYETLVNNRLEREGKESDFVAQAPKGRHHISKLICQSDRDANQYYMNLFMLTENYQSFVTYIDTTTGKEIPAEALAPWMPKKSESEQGGLEKKVIIMAPKLESIREIKCGDFKA